jgi:hypothetical protein
MKETGGLPRKALSLRLRAFLRDTRGLSAENGAVVRNVADAVDNSVFEGDSVEALVGEIETAAKELPAESAETLRAACAYARKRGSE